jgi:hypothetical protein
MRRSGSRNTLSDMGVDPLGGAGVHYWGPIAERYGLNLTVVNEVVDPTFRFMTVDWDGQIRMDPSSSYAMRSLNDLKDRFDIAFACDTDHDRHGIVTRSAGNEHCSSPSARPSTMRTHVRARSQVTCISTGCFAAINSSHWQLCRATQSSAAFGLRTQKVRTGTQRNLHL